MNARHTNLLSMAAIAVALSVSPALSAPGGGGGGGGMSMPSDSAPQYDPVAEYQAGISAYQAGDFKAAAKAFRNVLTVTPKHAPTQYLLGSSYLQSGDFKKAKGPLEKAVKFDAMLIDAQRDLGIVYARLADMAKATAQRDTLAARKDQCAGTCADAAKLDAALTAVQAALAGAPPQALLRQVTPMASVDAHYVAAVSKINEQRYAAAITELEGALWSAGPHPDVLTYLGFANRKLKRFDTAKQWYEMALTVAPNHRGAIEYYGELKLEMGDLAGAKAHLARLDKLCAFGCQQADELRRWIGEAGRSAS